MAFEYFACILRETNQAFADEARELWLEYEDGQTETAILVHQIDKLECIQQAVIYEERTGIDLSEFMSLAEMITLPELQPMLEICLQKHEEWKLRKQADIVVVFVSGGPGVGKGTQCSRLATEFDFCHISVGDLLREEANSQTSPFRIFITMSQKLSILLPPQLTTQLLEREMSKARANGKSQFLLDGFPRSTEQIEDFELKICNRYSTLSFNCSEKEMRQRLEHRSQSSDRIDDNPESIVKRLATFNENNAPVLQHLGAQGVYQIDCGGSIENVYSSVRNCLHNILETRSKEKLLS